MNPEGPHAGDLPNLHVPADGKLEVEFLDPVVTLDQEAALLDADGAAIVIHAGPDDYTDRPGRQCRRPHRLRRHHLALTVPHTVRVIVMAGLVPAIHAF